jgi:hypothetical protein
MTIEDYIWILLLFSGLGALIYGMIRLRKTKRVFITDYQRGVLYRKGTFAGILGPCSRSIYTPRDQVLIVDMRPVHIVIESVIYTDALHNPSVISIGAELTISDPYLASCSLKSPVNDSVVALRDVLHGFVSKTVIDTSVDARQNIVRDLEAAGNSQLVTVGMQLSNLEITEAWSRVVSPNSAAGAN